MAWTPCDLKIVQLPEFQCLGPVDPEGQWRCDRASSGPWGCPCKAFPRGQGTMGAEGEASPGIPRAEWRPRPHHTPATSWLTSHKCVS